MVTTAEFDTVYPHQHVVANIPDSIIIILAYIAHYHLVSEDIPEHSGHVRDAITSVIFRSASPVRYAYSQPGILTGCCNAFSSFSANAFC
jgi:hypothetical protein